MTTQSNLEVKSASGVDVRWQNKRSVIPLLMSFAPFTMDINSTRYARINCIELRYFVVHSLP